MVEKMIKGALAGLAGSAALNAATYADMAVRGRAASGTAEQVVEELAKRAGRGIPGGAGERQHRLQGLGALAGIGTGVVVGAVAGQFGAAVRRLGPVLGPVLVGGVAMAATDTSMAGLGVTDPRSWDVSSWVSDAFPHLAFGAVTWALLTR
jgi:hypothetical protein